MCTPLKSVIPCDYTLSSVTESGHVKYMASPFILSYDLSCFVIVEMPFCHVKVKEICVEFPSNPWNMESSGRLIIFYSE